MVPTTYDESETTFNIAVFDLITMPNPVVSTLTLKCDMFTNSNTTVEVYNHFGTRLITRAVSLQSSKEYTFSVDGLPNNVYYVVVTSNDRRLSKPIVVQH